MAERRFQEDRSGKSRPMDKWVCIQRTPKVRLIESNLEYKNVISSKTLDSSRFKINKDLLNTKSEAGVQTFYTCCHVPRTTTVNRSKLVILHFELNTYKIQVTRIMYKRLSSRKTIYLLYFLKYRPYFSNFQHVLPRTATVDKLKATVHGTRLETFHVLHLSMSPCQRL